MRPYLLVLAVCANDVPFHIGLILVHVHGVALNRQVDCIHVIHPVGQRELALLLVKRKCVYMHIALGCHMTTKGPCDVPCVLELYPKVL